MKNKHNKKSQQNHHDSKFEVILDCQDCIRQRKENQKLIAIYQRLQVIDNSSKLARKSFEKHKQQCEKTTSKFKDFVNKLNQVPKESKEEIQLKNLGYQMAHSMMQQTLAGTVAAENERLKNNLIRMCNSKTSRYPSLSLQRRSLSVSTDYRTQEEQQQIQSKTCKNRIKKSQLHNLDKDFRNSKLIQQIKQVRQPQQTQATGFFSQQTHNYQRNKRIDGLSLWLYDQQNKNLQEQLYQTRMPSRHRYYKDRKNKGSVLPALKNNRNKL